MELMAKLSAHLANRPAQLKNSKSEGVKIIGYFPGNYVPEEIIYASGGVPICLLHGGNPRAVDASLSGSTRFQCTFVRAQLGEKLLKEQPYYDMVDMLVVPVACRDLLIAGNMFEYYGGTELFKLGVPNEYDSEHGLRYYVGMLKLLKERLGRFTGNEIKDEKIIGAIEIYNKMRGLLKEISLMRKVFHPPISTLDFIKLNHASFHADPNFMVDILESLCQELRQRRGEITGRDTLRLLLTGSNIAYGDYKVLELAEETGGEIVVEEFCEGIRYYWDNVEADGDLLEAIANRYLKNRVPCAFMRSSARKRLDFITRLAKDFNVAGIIWYQLLYCEPYDIESYFFAEKMKKVGMPVLKLESDYAIEDRGPFKTRIEAFIETIRGR